MKNSKNLRNRNRQKKQNEESVVPALKQKSNYVLCYVLLISIFGIFCGVKLYYADHLFYVKEINPKATAENHGNQAASKTPYPGKLESDFKPFRIAPILFKKLKNGNRNLEFTKLHHQANSSSVEIFQVDNFLSKDECDALSRVHLKHIEEANKLSPLFCFADEKTMQKYLHSAAIDHLKLKIDDFIHGTTCLNESVSFQIKDFFGYSFSTAFYRGESKFSMIFEKRLEEISSLLPSHGGKFQITSYLKGIGYKLHADCELHKIEERDRYATALVYLQDVRKGGETIFPKLNITIKPKQGRLIVWNNMNVNGICDPTSVHQAATVIKGRKYILQRWYYYKNFKYLGRRPPEPELPLRKQYQPRVSCDLFEEGSCRWYDEWGYDHLHAYNNVKNKLV